MSGVDVSAMKFPELKEALSARGLDTRGSKAALAARLKSAMDADPTPFPKRQNGQPAFVSGGVWQAPVPPSGPVKTETAAPPPPPPPPPSSNTSGSSNVTPMEAKTESKASNGEEVTGVHPRMKLNEKLGKAAEFTTVSDSGQAHQKEYAVELVANGVTFKGVGRSQKLAKTDAATQALKQLFNIRYDPALSADTRSPMAGKKRKADGDVDMDGDAGGKKPKTVVQKNALMHLNELKPGCTFEIRDLKETPKGPSIFECTIDCNGQKFIGAGASKKSSKQAAAERCLESFVQFPDQSQAHQALGRGFLPYNADFSTDSGITSAPVYNSFENSGGSINTAPPATTAIASMTKAQRKHVSAMMSGQATPMNKNPVMMLNEMHRDVVYEETGMTGDGPRKVFNMKVVIQGREYTGSGRSKKNAKSNAALNALHSIHGINQFGNRDPIQPGGTLASVPPQSTREPPVPGTESFGSNPMMQTA